MPFRPGRILATALAALLVPATLLAAERPEPMRSLPRRVLMVSIDGLAPSAYLDPGAHGLKVPNLRRLAAEGAYAHAVTGVLPTMTYPSHTTLITGAPPRVHGILTNTVFDPMGTASQAWHWFYEEIRVPTLLDAAKRAGLTVGAVSWPVTVGAPIDANFPEIWRSGSTNPYDLHLQAALSTPGLVAAVEEELGHPLAWPLTDVDRTDVALHILRTLRPELMLVHLIEYDHWQHEDGPGSPAANAALERDDAQLGRLLAALKDLNLDAATLVVVVSDHGFLPTTTSLHPNVRLVEAGLITLKENEDSGGHDTPPCTPRVASWRAIFQTQDGTALLHLANPADAEHARQGPLPLRPRPGRPGHRHRRHPGAEGDRSRRRRPAGHPPRPRRQTRLPLRLRPHRRLDRPSHEQGHPRLLPHPPRARRGADPRRAGTRGARGPRRFANDLYNTLGRVLPTNPA